MDLFPDEWELIGLFECEPKLSDDDIPWAYNTLLFETTRGRDRLRCLIEAGYGDFRFHWWEGDKLRTQLELRFSWRWPRLHDVNVPRRCGWSAYHSI